MNWNEARGLTWLRCRFCYYRWYCQDRGEAERKDSLQKCPNCGHALFDVLPRDEDYRKRDRMDNATLMLIGGVGLVILILVALFLT